MSDCIRLKELHAHLALDLGLDERKDRVVERLGDPAQGGEKQWVGGQKLAPGSSKQPKTYLTRPSGIMVISESHTRGGESECEQGAEALAEAVAEAAHRPSADGPHSPKWHCGGGGTDEYRAEECLESAHASPHDRMVRAHKHEAALRNLVDPLLGEVLGGVLNAGKRRSGGKHVRIPTIYKITSPKGKVYVGQTVWPKVRMNKHKCLKESANSCRILSNAIAKYGWDAMKVEILRGGHDAVGGAVKEEELDALEVAFIEQFDCLEPNGYNIQKGGKVAWRGAKGLARNAPRGPRSVETIAKIKTTWELKRNARLAGLPEEEARILRQNQEKQAETRLAQRLGTWTNGRLTSGTNSQAAERKREAKLALLAPEVAAKERERLRKAREHAGAKYVRKA